MTELTIFHAGSLTELLQTAASQFQQKRSDVHIRLEGSGARQAVYKVIRQRRPCDIVASADFQLIEDLMKPEHAEFNIVFAGNRLGLSFTPGSRFAGEIDSRNWPEILLRDGVTYGHTDPEQDPAGYRARLCWQLAELYYKKPGLYRALTEKMKPEHILVERTTVRNKILSGELDYFFGYESSARKNGYQFVRLSPALDFSSGEYAAYYRQAELQLSGKQAGSTLLVTGMPIQYSLALVKEAPARSVAVEFLAQLLAGGAPLVQQAALIPLPPRLLMDEPACLPEMLRPFFTSR